MTVALRHIDPFTFTSMRYAIAGAVFAAVLWSREGRDGFRLGGERAGLAFLFGTAGFCGFQFLVFLGQKEVGADGALTASIMMATMPLLGFLVNWAIRRVLPPPGALAFILMSFVGITLVVTKGHYGQLIDHPSHFGPDGLIVLGAFFWVLYTAGASYFPDWSPVRYTTITTGLGLLSTFALTGTLLASGAVTAPSGHAIWTIIPELAYMSLVAAFVGVLSWNIGNKILTPLNGVLFMDVVPITAFTISAATGVIPAVAQVVGACTSATALVLNNIYLRHRLAQPAPAAPAPRAARVVGTGQVKEAVPLVAGPSVADAVPAAVGAAPAVAD
jgi:drug/metabolite transporter (DMT)-like permease